MKRSEFIPLMNTLACTHSEHRINKLFQKFETLPSESLILFDIYANEWRRILLASGIDLVLSKYFADDSTDSAVSDALGSLVLLGSKGTHEVIRNPECIWSMDSGWSRELDCQVFLAGFLILEKRLDENQLHVLLLQMLGDNYREIHPALEANQERLWSELVPESTLNLAYSFPAPYIENSSNHETNPCSSDGVKLSDFFDINTIK